jgi:hypothetical protein
VIAIALGRPELIGIGVTVAFMGLSMAFAISRYRSFGRRRGGELSAGPEGLSFRGALVVPRALLTSGVLLHNAGALPRVKLLGHGGTVVYEIEAPDRATADALMTATGVDPARAVTRVRLAWHVFGKTPVIIVLGWVPVLVIGPLIFGVSAVLERFGIGDDSPLMAGTSIAILALAAVGTVIFAMASKVHLAVGPDGVALKHFGKARFLRYEEIASVRQWPGKLVHGVMSMSEGFDLVLASGERIRLRTMAQRLAVGDQGDFVAEAIERGRALAATQHAELLLELERGGRSTPDWIHKLRALSSDRSGGYRVTEVPIDLLQAVIVNSVSRPLDRAAAAIAAAPQSADLLTQAARAVAMPELRAVFEAAALGDDAALARSLEALVQADDRLSAARPPEPNRGPAHESNP